MSRALFDNIPGADDGVDDIGPDALGDFDAYGRLAVEERVTGAVGEGAAHFRDVGDRDDAVAAGPQRDRHEIAAVLEHAGGLYDEAAILEID